MITLPKDRVEAYLKSHGVIAYTQCPNPPRVKLMVADAPDTIPGTTETVLSWLDETSAVLAEFSTQDDGKVVLLFTAPTELQSGQVMTE